MDDKVRVRNLLGGPLAIHNRRMVDGKYESVDGGEVFSFLLAAGAEEWVPTALLESTPFRQALTRDMIVVVTFEMLHGKFRFLHVEEEIFGG